ncbi:MAG: DUF1192 domain-containing protein [Pseudomonadota bacterium]
MFDEEERKKPAAEIVIGEDLSSISVDELAERITTLEAEISRIRAEIVSKQATRTTADNFFKS